MRTFVRALVLVAALSTACGTTTQITGIKSGPAHAPGPPAASAELDALVAAAPDGFQPLGAPFGPIDVNRFLVSFAGDAPAKDLAFIRQQFVRGVARGWSDPGGTILSVAVFEFRDEAGSRWLSDNELSAPDQAVFTVPGIPDAHGTSYTGKAANGTVRYHQVFFARGAKLYLVFTASPDLQAGPDLVLQFAGVEAGVAR